MLYVKVRVNPKTSHHKKKFFSLDLILYIDEMIDIYYTYWGRHFMMNANHITLYTLNLFSPV